MKSWLKENWFKMGIVLSILIVAISLAYYFFGYSPSDQNTNHQQISFTPDNTQQQNNATTTTPNPASNFVCPENLLSGQAQVDALAKFISAYQEANPNATVGDMETYRYNLLVSDSCTTTLANMLKDVSQLDQMLRFNGENFGPQDTQFSQDTNVWSSYFTLNGQGLTNPNEELIFNFYLQNVWASSTVSAKDVANVFANSFSRDSNSTVLYKFTAPDTITKNPDYFIFSDTIYPDQNYGYIYIAKISSIQNSAFSVLYAKRFIGDATDLQNDINSWLAQDLKSAHGLSSAVGNIGVDASWLGYLAKKQP